MTEKPQKPTPDFPLTPHNSGRWSKKIGGKTCYFGPWADPDAALARYQAYIAGQPIAPKRKGSRGDKPEKPYPAYPLTPHNNGQWCKRIKGTLHYFGPWDDPEAALVLYKQQVDALQAGATPKPPAQSITLEELFDKFANRRRTHVETGELDLRTWTEYLQICKRVVAIIDKTREVASLREDDFQMIRDGLAKRQTGTGTVSLVTLDNCINRLRCVFSYAASRKVGWLEREPDYGGAFDRPSKRALRIERGRRPKKLFTAEEIRTMIDKAATPLKAFILLGINCGFENKDCALLRFENLDLKNRWINYPRPKTGVDRRCPLWAETAKAIKEAIDCRPEREGLEEYVFLTKYGNLWCNTNGAAGSAISGETGKLLKEIGNRRKGVGFLALRHTFQTVAEGCGDLYAVKSIMGHADEAGDMSPIYREQMDDSRLRAVANFVRTWVFRKPKVKTKAG